MQETCVQSLGQENPLEKGMATYSSILAWRILWTAWQATNPQDCKESDAIEQLTPIYTHIHCEVSTRNVKTKGPVHELKESIVFLKETNHLVA